MAVLEFSRYLGRMLLDAFYASPWPGLLMWAALYTSDLLFTMTCARLYQRGAREVVFFEGSYEITPYYQDDVDHLRVFSPRFFVALAVTCALQGLMWYLTMGAGIVPEMYLLAVGAMILVELTVHVRHVRNYFLFRSLVAGEGITGHIEYPRPIMLRLSAIEISAFAAVYAILFLVTRSWFVLGGTIACLSVAINHLKLSRTHKPSGTK